MVLAALSYAGKWIHLVSVFVFLACLSTLQLVVTLLYRIPPLSSVCDCLWWRSRRLRRLFSYKLSGWAASHEGDPQCEMTTLELIHAHGYQCEEHVVETDDGYILTLFRIPAVKSITKKAGKGVAKKKGKGRDNGDSPSVLLWHGLMMSSDFWLLQKGKSLPFMLADTGYDVWLGNSRANKYSCKHRSLKPNQFKFWDFSLDELAKYDLPNTIAYICDLTRHEQLSYIGFSNGSAQGFAALARTPSLGSRVRNFIALSPAVRVTNIASTTVASLITATPEFLYLLFGSKAILPSATTWQRILSPAAFVRVIDQCVQFLFAWDGLALDPDTKPLLYAHYYSYSSVKQVAHWFQIIKTGRFQMYDDGLHDKHTQPPVYDVSKITTPITLFVGGKDTLIDYPTLMTDLHPDLSELHVLPEYEHVDTVWARDAPKRVYHGVVERLNSAWDWSLVDK